jgi:DmsE family decaheme c-type cytochrome
MTNRIALVILLVATPLATASAEDDFKLKPGARGKVCFGCHVDMREVTQLPSVHSPVAAGECSDCHNPHASDHGMLLSADESNICATCHSDVVPDVAVSIHEAVVSGECINCHDPHGSQHGYNLVVSQAELCVSCHAEIGEHIETARFKHSPVQSGCVSCHDPHASPDSEFLLTAEVSNMCTECHDPGSAAFTERHSGYSVGASRCTSCHDPHGSDVPGLLWAGVHAPLRNEMCSQCHSDPSSPDALSLQRAGVNLCRGCHSSEVNRMLSTDRIHWPAVDGMACLNCHSPHASSEQALLTKPTLSLCADCHSQPVDAAATSVTQHTPVVDGDCSICHEPHASDQVFLLTEANETALCSTCHDWTEHSSHPIGDEVFDVRNSNLTIGCNSCHNPHGSGFKSLTIDDPSGPLCVKCHEGMSR